MKGVGAYPREWEAIATDVKARAGWRCIRCGHPYALQFSTEHAALAGLLEHGLPAHSKIRILPEGGGQIRSGALPCDGGCGPHKKLPAKPRVLTVHHLDGDKANGAWWNLAALCQVCHLQVQGRVVMSQTWMHPHTPWFRPYVAGYYAYTLLGEDLRRDEVERRLCELLTLGQPDLAEFYIKNV